MYFFMISSSSLRFCQKVTSFFTQWPFYVINSDWRSTQRLSSIKQTDQDIWVLHQSDWLDWDIWVLHQADWFDRDIWVLKQADTDSTKTSEFSNKQTDSTKTIQCSIKQVNLTKTLDCSISKLTQLRHLGWSHHQAQFNNTFLIPQKKPAFRFFCHYWLYIWFTSLVCFKYIPIIKSSLCMILSLHVTTTQSLNWTEEKNSVFLFWHHCDPKIRTKLLKLVWEFFFSAGYAEWQLITPERDNSVCNTPMKLWQHYCSQKCLCFLFCWKIACPCRTNMADKNGNGDTSLILWEAT